MFLTPISQSMLYAEHSTYIYVVLLTTETHNMYAHYAGTQVHTEYYYALSCFTVRASNKRDDHIAHCERCLDVLIPRTPENPHAQSHVCAVLLEHTKQHSITIYIHIYIYACIWKGAQSYIGAGEFIGVLRACVRPRSCFDLMSSSSESVCRTYRPYAGHMCVLCCVQNKCSVCSRHRFSGAPHNK